ncbi:MAG: hypothetical protein R3B13_00010 [Polyangiaceae bacterium]
MYARREVGAPGAKGQADPLYVLPTGFAGYAVLPSDTASAAPLHMWEVPGTVILQGTLPMGECRRARAHSRFSGADLGFVVAVRPASE